MGVGPLLWDGGVGPLFYPYIDYYFLAPEFGALLMIIIFFDPAWRVVTPPTPPPPTQRVCSPPGARAGSFLGPLFAQNPFLGSRIWHFKL